MSFSITEFSSKINQYGAAKNNLFLAKITPPALLLDDEVSMPTRDMPFFCRSAELPGFDIQTADIQNQGFGIIEKRAIGLQHNVLPTVFMVDSNFTIKNFFHRWAQLIYKYDGLDVVYDNQYRYETNYKEDYVGSLDIDVYSHNSPSSVYTYRFGNVYPINIGTTSVAWENGAEVMTLPVGFTYDRLQVSGNKIGDANPLIDRSNGILSYLSALNAYGNAVNNITQSENLQDLIDNLSYAYRLPRL